MTLPRINRYLQSGDGLQPVIAKAREISELSRRCIEVLPPELARHVRGANIRDDMLVVLAANPAAAAKLKMLAGTLSAAVLKQGSKVKGVSVRVQPAPPEADVALQQKHAVLTCAALEALGGLRGALAESPLRRALDRLLAASPLEEREGSPGPVDQIATSSRSPKRSNRAKRTTPRQT